MSRFPQPPDWGDLVSRHNTSWPSFGAQPILPKIGILLRGWAEIALLLSSSTAVLGGTWSGLYNVDHKLDKVKLSASCKGRQEEKQEQQGGGPGCGYCSGEKVGMVVAAKTDRDSCKDTWLWLVLLWSRAFPWGSKERALPLPELLARKLHHLIEKVSASMLTLGLDVVVGSQVPFLCWTYILHSRNMSGQKYVWMTTSQAQSICLFTSNPGCFCSFLQRTWPHPHLPVRASMLHSHFLCCYTEISELTLLFVHAGQSCWALVLCTEVLCSEKTEMWEKKGIGWVLETFH